MRDSFVLLFFAILSFFISYFTPLHDDSLWFHTTFLKWELSNIWLFDFLFVGIVLTVLLAGIYFLVKEFASQEHAIITALFVLFFKTNSLMLGFVAVASLLGLALLPWLFLSFFLFERRKQWKWLGVFVGLTGLLAFTYGYWLLAVMVLPFAELLRQAIQRKIVSRQTGIATVFVAGFGLLVVLASVLGTVSVYPSGNLFGFSGLGQSVLERHMEVITFIFLPAFIGLPLIGLLGYFFKHRLNALTFYLFSVVVLLTLFQAFFDFTRIALFIPYMRLALLNSVLLLLLCGYGFAELFKAFSVKSVPFNFSWTEFETIEQHRTLAYVFLALFVFLNLCISATFWENLVPGDQRQVYYTAFNGVYFLDVNGNDLWGQAQFYTASPELIRFVLDNNVVVDTQLHYQVRRVSDYNARVFRQTKKHCYVEDQFVVTVNQVQCPNLELKGRIAEGYLWHN